MNLGTYIPCLVYTARFYYVIYMSIVSFLFVNYAAAFLFIGILSYFLFNTNVSYLFVNYLFIRCLHAGIELLNFSLVQSNMVLAWMFGLQLAYLLSSFYAVHFCR